MSATSFVPYKTLVWSGDLLRPHYPPLLVLERACLVPLTKHLLCACWSFCWEHSSLRHKHCSIWPQTGFCTQVVSSHRTPLIYRLASSPPDPLCSSWFSPIYLAVLAHCIAVCVYLFMASHPPLDQFMKVKTLPCKPLVYLWCLEECTQWVINKYMLDQ